MRTIEVDEDAYLHIARNTQEIGESASEILRRLLQLSETTQTPQPSETTQPFHQGGAGAEHELAAAIADPKLLTRSAAVDRFLYFLAVAYTQKGSDFEKVLMIQGRGQTYFAKSKEEIAKSGNSTQPRRIPGTPYWVMTNSPTSQKRQMLRDALKLLGYSDVAVKAATTMIQ